MFETIFSSDRARRGRVRKALTVSLSLLFHAAAIIAVIVVPLLRAEAVRPELAVINAALISPPAIPVVPPGRSNRDNGKASGPDKRPKDSPPPHGPHELTIPFEIPTTISDEDLFVLDSDGPGGPGVPDSPGEGEDGPWDYGKEIVPEAIDSNAVAIAVIKPPRLVKRVNPAYPITAIIARVSGPVVIAAVTDIYGRVREARVISGHGLLAMSALEAVREWIYEPSLVNGIPKPVRFTVTVTFTLDKR